eukprot:990647-Amphidinium_carterae.1
MDSWSIMGTLSEESFAFLVGSPLSCVECMVMHMRSRLHSLSLPFDMLGFPILEDERNFGAFRGRLRVASGRLFLEPMTQEASVDGCVR